MLLLLLLSLLLLRSLLLLPCVVHVMDGWPVDSVGQVEKICLVSKKKVISEGPGRFKKDLPTYGLACSCSPGPVCTFVISCNAFPPPSFDFSS